MSWTASELVNYSPATDRPRAIHFRLGTLEYRKEGHLAARTFHLSPSVVAATATSTRAKWIDARIVLVPRLATVGLAYSLSVAFGSDTLTPLSLEELLVMPACHHFTGGSTGEMPSVFSIPVSFDDAGVSELIKPAPIELQRICASVHGAFSLADQDRDLPDDKAPLFDFFLSGHFSLGGVA